MKSKCQVIQLDVYTCLITHSSMVDATSEESDQFALMPSVGFVMRWLINVVANAAQREYSF